MLKSKNFNDTRAPLVEEDLPGLRAGLQVTMGLRAGLQVTMGLRAGLQVTMGLRAELQVTMGLRAGLSKFTCIVLET